MCAFFVCVFTSITYTVPLCHHVDRHIFKFLIVPDYSQVSYVVVLTSKALCVVQAFGARQCVTPNTLCHSPIAPSLLAQIYTCDRSKNMNKSPSKGCVGLDSYGLCIASMTACGIVLPVCGAPGGINVFLCLKPPSPRKCWLFAVCNNTSMWCSC